MKGERCYPPDYPKAKVLDQTHLQKTSKHESKYLLIEEPMSERGVRIGYIPSKKELTATQKERVVYLD